MKKLTNFIKYEFLDNFKFLKFFKTIILYFI